MKGLVGGIPLALLLAALQAQAMEQGTSSASASYSKTSSAVKPSGTSIYGVALAPGAGPFPKLPPGGASGAGPFYKRNWPVGGTAIGGPSGDDEGQSFNMPITGVFTTEVTEVHKDDHSIKVKDTEVNAPMANSHPGPEFVHGPETGYRAASDNAESEHFHVPATEYRKRWDEFGGTAIGGPSGNDGDGDDFEGSGDAPYVGGGTALGGPSGDDGGVSFGAPVSVGINTKVKEYTKDDHSINVKHEDIWYKREWDPREGSSFVPHGVDEFGDPTPDESEPVAPSRGESQPSYPHYAGGTAIGGPSGNDGGQSFNMPISVETNTDIKEKYQDDHSISVKHEDVYAPPHFVGGHGPYVPEGSALPFERRAVRNPAPTADRVTDGPGGGTAEGGPSGDDDGIDFSDPEDLGISTDVDEKHQDNHAIKVDDTTVHGHAVPEMPWMTYSHPEAPKAHSHTAPQPPVAEPAPPAPPVPAPAPPSQAPQEPQQAPQAPQTPAVDKAPQEPTEATSAPEVEEAPQAPKEATPAPEVEEAPQAPKQATPAPAVEEAPQTPKEATPAPAVEKAPQVPKEAPPAPVVEESHATPEAQTPPCTTRTEEILLTVTKTAHKQVHSTETVYAEPTPSHAVENSPSAAVPTVTEPVAQVVESSAAAPPIAAAPTPSGASPDSSSSWPTSAPTETWSTAPTDASWSSVPTATPTESWSSPAAPTETPFEAPKQELSVTPVESWSSTHPVESWSSTPTPTDSWSSAADPTPSGASPDSSSSWPTSAPTESWSSSAAPTETPFEAPKQELSVTPVGSWSSTPPVESWSSTPTDSWSSALPTESWISSPSATSVESEAPTWSAAPFKPTSSMVAIPSPSVQPSPFASSSPSPMVVFKGAATHVTGGIVSAAAAIVGVLAFVL